MVTFLTCSSAKTRSPALRLGPCWWGRPWQSRSNLDQDHTVFDDLWCFRAVYTPQGCTQLTSCKSWAITAASWWRTRWKAAVGINFSMLLGSGSNSWKTGTTDILPISSPSVFLCEEYWKRSGAHLFPWGTESKTASRDWQPQDANFLAIRDTITCGNSM